jgi:glutamine synthetase
MANPPKTIARHVELLVTDMNGVPRGKVVEGDSLQGNSRPHMALANFFQTITGDYADLIDEANPRDEDMLLEPDWSTYRSVPWRKHETAQMICRTLEKSGVRSPYDPRNILIKLLEQFGEEGWYPIVAPEVEFYLLEPMIDSNMPLQPAKGTGGRSENGGDSFSPDALDKYQGFVDLLQDCCDGSGLEIKGLVHEMGPAQLELNVSHGEPLSRADQLFLLKRTVKACALQSGFTATFLAKPLKDYAGNGLHLHSSMLDGNGKNLFALSNGEAPALLKHFIGGLQIFLPQIFALIAPSINSYKRFVPDLSAPTDLEWGYDNRTVGLRVPFDTDENGRIENRVAGADANPYLFMIAALASGYLGMKQGLEPRPPIADRASDLTSAFPVNLHEALLQLADCKEIIDLLGQPMIDAFISVKQAEMRHHDTQITPWERRYLTETL